MESSSLVGKIGNDGTLIRIADHADGTGMWIHGVPKGTRLGAKYDGATGQFYDNPPTEAQIDEAFESGIDAVARLNKHIIWVLLRALIKVVWANKSTLVIPPDVAKLFKKVKDNF